MRFNSISAAFLGLFAICFLSACGSSEKDQDLQLSQVSYEDIGPLLPLPDEVPVHDPDDGLFMDSVSAWLQNYGASPHSRYEFTRVDLDGDGRREGLVMLENPHQEWCMEYGCTMFIFRAHDEGFSYLSEVSPVRGPLTVADSRTNGWRDIVVYVSGRASGDAKNVALKFDGTAYPSQPAIQPAITLSMLDNKGVRIFP